MANPTILVTSGYATQIVWDFYAFFWQNNISFNFEFKSFTSGSLNFTIQECITRFLLRLANPEPFRMRVEVEKQVCRTRNDQQSIVPDAPRSFLLMGSMFLLNPHRVSKELKNLFCVQNFLWFWSNIFIDITKRAYVRFIAGADHIWPIYRVALSFKCSR